MAFVPPGTIAPVSPQNQDASSLFGYGVDPLKVGPVTFYTIEGPEELAIGAVEQRIAVQEQVGGGRDVARLGAQPKPVTWTGRLFQPSLETQIESLRAVLVAANEILVSWRSEQYYGILKDVTPKYHHANYSDYEVAIEITRDNNGALTTTTLPSVDSQVNNLGTNAGNQANALAGADPNASGIQAAVTALLNAIAAVSPIAALAGPAALSLVGNVAGVLSLLNSYLATQTEGSATWLQASQLTATLTLMQLNLAQTQSTVTTKVQGDSFVELASTQYGDPSLAFSLATANGSDSIFTSRQKSSIIVYPALASS